MFEQSVNQKLKIFSKLFVGLKTQVGSTSTPLPQVPLGFATPFENNAAFEKRKQTVLDWSIARTFDYETQTQTDVTLKPIIIDNEPAAGFKITDDIKRTYWGGGNVVWRVHDPRGFELEISSNNMMALIQTVGLAPGGLINGKCVWARDSGVNVLLHESSEEYKNAILKAEGFNRTSSKGTVGQTYVMASGEIGIFLGKYHVHASRIVYYDNNHEKSTAISPTGAKIPIDIVEVRVEYAGTYDAIKMGETIKFYKKAPLVTELPPGEKLDVSAIMENTDNKVLAASGRYAKIVSVNLVKRDLKFALQPIPEERWLIVKENVEATVSEARQFSSPLFEQYYAGERFQ